MASKSGNKLLPVVVIVGVLLIIGYFTKDKLMSKYSTSSNQESSAVKSASELGLNVEFLNLDNNYAKTDGPPFGYMSHVVVASNGEPDVRTSLPYGLKLTVDGETVWESNIEGDASVVCRDATGCSIDGPYIEPEWEGKLIELYVTVNGETYLLWSSAN